MSNNNNNEGKKLSFFQLIEKEGLNIEIPIIQRDYAQGRKAATSIRNEFVNALFRSLEKQQPLHLDFIYGNVIDGKLTPLDGQQRLTTLFLLHWFLAIKEDKFELFETFFRDGLKSRFSYETRLSSRDFCKELVNHEIILSKDFPTYEKYIKNCNWYFSSWDRDPTIQSMLVMLDSFREIYEEVDKDISFLDQLLDEANPTITFQFIELRDFGLTDSLYIKMNARGKPLTDFENFKAKFEKLLKTFDKLNNTVLAPYFEDKIDTTWTDVFWAFRNKQDHLFDKEFMNFIRVVATNSVAAQDDPDFQALKSMTKDKADYGFYELETYGAFNNTGINDIISFLDLIDNNGDFKKYLSSSDILDEEKLFLDVSNYDLTYIKRLQFYALYKYIDFNKNSLGIEEWVRVIRNLTSNSVYRQAESFETAVKTINLMLPESSNILAFLKNGYKPNGFLKYQLDEEEIKAFLIERSPLWEEKIKEIENHKYFNGQIEFLLDFAGITEFFKENGDCNWNSVEDENFQEKFDFYSARARTVFIDSGLREFPNYIFERALLSIGNYTLPKGRNRSFLVDVDREIGWKRLLRDSDNNKRYFVKLLFDEIQDIDKIENELTAIISRSSTQDWRTYFIEYPDVLKKCGKEKFFRVDPYLKYRDILILEKRQTNGIHREYYTYGLCCALRRLGHEVNYITQNSVDLDKYISYINDQKVEISYDTFSEDNEGAFIVETETEYQTFEEESDVIDFLIKIEIL
mgnify:CR=1 FL=1